MTTPTRRAVTNYTPEFCIAAFWTNRQDGEGAATLGVYFNKTTRQMDAAINAGRELVNALPAVFDYLHTNGMQPTWQAGNYVVANVPHYSECGGQRIKGTTPEVVRSMAQAVKLVHACQ